MPYMGGVIMEEFDNTHDSLSAESEHHGRKASTANQATPPPFAAKSVMGYRQGM